MSRHGGYFGTGRRRAEEETLISDEEGERSGADEAGMLSSSAPAGSSYYGAASDVSTDYGEDQEVRSDREIARKLREPESGGIWTSSSTSRRKDVDAKVWAVRSLAVVLAVAMIFVVSVSKPGRNAADVAISGPNSEPSPPSTTTTNLVASNLPPNVVFILADDLGYHSLNVDVSPFLMQMRGNGVILGKYYSQEVCTPARAALLTGRYPISVGWQKNEASVIETGGLGLAETTLAEVLKSKGYTTFMFGKWNLGNSSPRCVPDPFSLLSSLSLTLLTLLTLPRQPLLLLSSSPSLALSSLPLVNPYIPLTPLHTHHPPIDLAR